MKYLIILTAALFMSAAAAQTGDDCYPGLGLCEDDVTAQMPLPSRINIGTPDENATSTQSGQSSQSQSTQQPAAPANPICIVYDVRPPDAWLALRTEPSSRTGTRLYKLPSGTRIEMMGPRDGAWHLVRVPDGTIGWVSWQRQRWIAC
ncbi:SH3 domain-containing protein [Pseudohalocynthiibacter aestuariivivens]|uniref:SH3 domain-containing protein n=1 Tax=Roseovarius pelagicus TaxID=2980108 RepID=A0ABY6DEI9_9RHOB|nr:MULTISPECIES: SH3 domain-containing protein [Rhodobacterales]QIE46906.1 SH3 domain-containing protein [Pseudohalocynthiibacter aestuariivivens]UXX84548.1 SH3 domain-containing protein [Roseovarius pelagicus]